MAHRSKKLLSALLTVPTLLLNACTSHSAGTATISPTSDRCTVDEIETGDPPTVAMPTLLAVAQPLSQNPARTVDMTVKPAETTGPEWNPSGIGLSMESLVLTEPGFDSGNLAKFLRMLGPGLIRIGGNSADQTFWTSRNEPAPDWSEGTLDPAAIKRLAHVAKASGWGVILTVNIKHDDAQRAADMAVCAKRALGSNLRAFALANEGDYLRLTPEALSERFGRYKTAIQQLVPGAKFVGPDAGQSTDFDAPFVNAVGAENVEALSRHFYVNGACEDKGQRPTMETMLDAGRYWAGEYDARDLTARGEQLGVPTMYGETANLYCQGRQGVSDTDGAALQAIGFTAKAQAMGVPKIMLHGTIERCDAPKPEGMAYSPFCAPHETGEVVAKPVAYGILAMKQVPAGRFVRLINNNEGIHGFGITTDNMLSIVLTNTDLKTHGTTRVHLAVDGRPIKSATSLELAPVGPDGFAATDITLGGVRITSEGELKYATSHHVDIRDFEVDVDLDQGAARILTLNY